ncbi:MAG: hypothetical protein V3U62_00890, partial [Sedimenticolaceae bacterium]
GFEDAYKLASDIRQELADIEEISLDDLRAKVIKQLEALSGVDIIEAYQSSGRIPATIMVRDAEGQVSPFSRTENLHRLESCSLSSKSAKMASLRIYQHLVDNEISETSSSKLGHLTYCLPESEPRSKDGQTLHGLGRLPAQRTPIDTPDWRNHRLRKEYRCHRTGPSPECGTYPIN